MKKETEEKKVDNKLEPEFQLSLKGKLFFNSTIESNYESEF